MNTPALENLFDKGMELFHITNTAYPLSARSLIDYKVRDADKIKGLLRTDIAKMDKVSLYIHIPFCKSRCKFCEYCVASGAESEMKDAYVARLCKEIGMYKGLIGNREIVGFDIGGGTPTELSEAQLSTVMKTVRDNFNLDSVAAASIETTPVNAANQPEKLKHIRALGFPRISMGVQSVNRTFLEHMGREGDNSVYRRATDNIRAAGFGSFNIDLMYGFRDQGPDDFLNTVNYAISLDPEHITLYEMRYKFTQIIGDAKFVSKQDLNGLYACAYDALAAAGYVANYGKNTFSRVPGDYGTSSYLTERVVNGVPYIGMGAGAQSFGLNYLAYNSGAATKTIKEYMRDIDDGRFPIQDIYDLPRDESIAKAISVMFYFGFIDYKSFASRFGVGFHKVFEKEIEFLKSRGLMDFGPDRAVITKRGVENMNGVIPMFYSARSKIEMMNTKNFTK
ncbi:MAG: coproporphyrinogen III oxidase family protein [Proteobacteria bacterium]|nr:coproporphyrinogen III oxidase family protein [Pseudomonadota bacterium]